MKNWMDKGELTCGKHLLFALDGDEVCEDPNCENLFDEVIDEGTYGNHSKVYEALQEIINRIVGVVKTE